MGLEFSSFASGSSGNCYMVRSEGTVLLVDVGIAGKHVIAGLREHGHEPEHVDGILVTHEHIDHIKSIRMMGRKGIADLGALPLQAQSSDISKVFSVATRNSVS